MMELDIRSPIPLHVQLRTLIKREIWRGTFTEKIPSERELMEKYSVSRTTVREAVSALVREGILEKIHGKGTFISLKPIEDCFGQLQSFVETIRLMGMEPSAKVMKNDFIKAPENVRAKMGFDEVYFVERLQFADNKPIGIGRHYFPVHIGSKLKEHDLEQAEMYNLLERSLGIMLFEADLVIKSEIPTEQEAKYMDILPTASVLSIERVTRDIDGNVVEFLSGMLRGDMFSFRLNMTRNWNNASGY